MPPYTSRTQRYDLKRHGIPYIFGLKADPCSSPVQTTGGRGTTGCLDAGHGRIGDVNVNAREDAKNSKPRASLMQAMLARVIILLGQDLLEELMSLLLGVGLLLPAAGRGSGINQSG